MIDMLAGPMLDQLGPILAQYLTPAQADRAQELMADFVSRLSPWDMLAVMGELVGIKAALDGGAHGLAAERASELAERYGAHELVAFLTEVTSATSSDNPTE